MKILLSPAKSLNEKVNLENMLFTEPTLLSSAKKLMNELKKLNPSQLQELMKLSPALAELNFNRFQAWNTPFNVSNSQPCGWTFSGAAYKGLDFESMNEKAKNYAQTTLRILSGLYGFLKPFDLIQPYRLEMGTRLKVDETSPNLYKFWGDTITENLNEEIKENEWVVNLASNEYFKSININKLKGKLVDCVFKENKNGEYKIIMSYAKTARGLMSRFILENFIEEKEDLLAFNSSGYMYSPKMSSESELVFIR